MSFRSFAVAVAGLRLLRISNFAVSLMVGDCSLRLVVLFLCGFGWWVCDCAPDGLFAACIWVCGFGGCATGLLVVGLVSCEVAGCYWIVGVWFWWVLICCGQAWAGWSGLAWVALLFVVVGFACGFLWFLFEAFVAGGLVCLVVCCSWCLLW